MVLQKMKKTAEDFVIEVRKQQSSSLMTQMLKIVEKLNSILRNCWFEKVENTFVPYSRLPMGLHKFKDMLFSMIPILELGDGVDGWLSKV